MISVIATRQGWRRGAGQGQAAGVMQNGKSHERRSNSACPPGQRWNQDYWRQRHSSPAPPYPQPKKIDSTPKKREVIREFFIKAVRRCVCVCVHDGQRAVGRVALSVWPMLISYTCWVLLQRMCTLAFFEDIKSDSYTCWVLLQRMCTFPRSTNRSKQLMRILT